VSGPASGGLTLNGGPTGSGGASLLLRGVRVVDGRGLRAAKADVRIDDGRIVQISERPVAAPAARDGSVVLDLDGRTVAPGLMNAHSHICLDGTSPDPEAILRAESPAENAVRSARRLERILRMGVTSIRDVGAPWAVDIALRRLVESGEIPGPRMVTCGQNICMTGGHGNWMGMEADGPEGVRQAVRTQIKRGAFAIKLMSTGGMMTPGQKAGAPQFTIAEMAAACEEAHKAGFPVGAHAESDEGVRNAVLAGVDSVEHGHGATTETLALMVERGTSLTPTILSDRAIIEGGVEAGIPKFVVDKCVPLGDALIETLQNAFRMGVTITAGNDGGAPLVEVGQMAEEISWYVRLGLSSVKAVESATINTARLFRLDEVGYLEEGWHADLVVLAEDPLDDVLAYRRPETVIKAGIVYDGLEQPTMQALREAVMGGAMAGAPA
jgi:imidazolonepropionase-like amidohydrolase